MGFLDQANTLANTSNAVDNAKANEVLILVQLLQMQWPDLNQHKAADRINKYLRSNKLHV